MDGMDLWHVEQSIRESRDLFDSRQMENREGQ